MHCSLVCNKKLSEILPSNGLSPGPGEVGQGGLKVLHLWCHSQKSTTPNQKIVIECRLEDLLCHLSLWTGFYHFWHPSYTRAKPQAIWLFFRKNPQNRPDAKVLNVVKCFLKNTDWKTYSHNAAWISSKLYCKEKYHLCVYDSCKDGVNKEHLHSKIQQIWQAMI